MKLFASKKVFSYKKALLILTIILVLVGSNFTFAILQAQATGQLSSASILISDPRPGISGSSLTYTIGFKWATSYTVKCVKVAYVTTAAGSTEPTGMVTTSAAKGTVSGTGLTNSNWSLWNSTDGVPQFEDATGDAITSGNAATFPMNTLTNPTSASTFYAQITTYDTLTTHTCSGVKDTITIAFATTSGIYTSVTVDPSLSFSVAGVSTSQTVNSDAQTTTAVSTANTIPFGTVAGNALGVSAQDLTVSTNTAGGYTIYASYSAALTDGAAHTIADATGTNASPATFVTSTTTSAFGYTTESTSLSGSASRFASAKYAKFLTTGTEIAGNAAAPAAVASQTTRVGYKVAISNLQAPGTYTTTIGLVATPTY
jgi:hypothetical protein